MKIVICPDGKIISLYQEILDLSRCGRADHRRASQVEPTVTGEWIVDLSPVGGPTLGPFARRSDALAEETAWLSRRLEEIAERLI